MDAFSRACLGQLRPRRLQAQDPFKPSCRRPLYREACRTTRYNPLLFMETPVSHAVSIQSQALPAPQEAALLYAHGRARDAAAALERAIAPDAEYHQNCDAWDMLFDLHRAEADWRAFEQLAARFEGSFGLAAPDWLANEETAHLPPEMQHGGSAYFDPVGMLDDEAAARLDSMRKRASSHSALHLDLSKVTDIAERGCLRLSQTLRFLYGNGNSVLVTGGDRLVGLLRSAAEGNGAEPGYWFLLLDLYQLRGMQADFERTALAYALAAGDTPPSWQAAVRPVVAPRSIDEKRDEPRYEPAPDLIELRGIMAGAADPQLRELQQFAVQRQYVNVNLSRVARMDFACATGFTRLVNTLTAAGKMVRLIRPNALVEGLLASFDLAAGVSVAKSRI
jgi:ABC-type transporter Mla MlaB component